MNDIFTKDLSGEIVSPNEPGYDALIDDIFACMETSQELNTVSIRNQKRVHELMEIILGKTMPENTTLLPPLYIDYGKPVTIGEKCNLITINHDVNPDNRSATYGRPIVIEDKVWIGINSTILLGVKISYGSIVGAQSVVTRDVPPMTVVAGNPARIIRNIEL